MSERATSGTRAPEHPADRLGLHDQPRGDTRRRDVRARRMRRQSRRRRSSVVLVVCLALFGGAAYAGYGFVRPIYDDLTESKDFTGDGTGTVEVQIEQGATGRAIGATLEQAGVVKTAGAFVDAAEADPRSGQIQPGSYGLRSQMSAGSALTLLLDPVARLSIRITLPEAMRAAQALELIAADTGIAVADLEAALADPAVGLPPESGGAPDGYLFPATYEFDPDTGAVEILAAMVSRYTQAMDAAGVPAERRRDVLTRASLVEAEVSRAEDYAKVATVFENRLVAGMPLQLDTTVDYATGKRGVTTTADDRATDSPYNTYLYPGLPAGPINSPGEAGIRAVTNPEPGPWLFFVAVNPDTGETRFAVTFEEHSVNVELFRQWLRENGG